MSRPTQIERPPQLVVAGVDDNSTASSQEAVPLPYFFGQRAGAARFISPIYNQFAREAPQARPAKK